MKRRRIKKVAKRCNLDFQFLLEYERKCRALRKQLGWPRKFKVKTQEPANV